MRTTNIEVCLQKHRKKSISEKEILAHVASILEDETQRATALEQRLQKVSHESHNSFTLDLLETQRIYPIDTIKNICVEYRLRFLDSKYFKGLFPQQAISKIKLLEKEHGIQIKGFKVMAPSKLFKLEDKDDPLLFAPIGNGYFYLIHKWGNDLHPLRKLLVWPFKGLGNLTATTLLVSYLAALAVPNGFFSKDNGAMEFWLIFFFMFKWIAAVVIYYAFAKGKNFNPAIWNSKYFNS